MPYLSPHPPPHHPQPGSLHPAGLARRGELHLFPFPGELGSLLHGGGSPPSLPRALRASSTEKDREGEGEGGGESSRQACEIQAGAGRLLPHVTQPNIISWPYLPYKKATLEKRGNHGGVKITNLKGHLLNRFFMTPRTILKMFKILSSTGCFTTLDTRVLQRPIFLETT